MLTGAQAKNISCPMVPTPGTSGKEGRKEKAKKREGGREEGRERKRGGGRERKRVQKQIESKSATSKQNA